MEIYQDGIGDVRLINVMGTDRTAVESARVSFSSDEFTGFDDEPLSEKDEKLLAFLIRSGHTSVHEHSVLTFRITCPLYISKQIMRHRTFSYNEISRRYTSKDMEFFVPHHFRKQAEKNLQCSTQEGVDNHMEALKTYEDIVKKAKDAYDQLIELGVCREQARGVLPNCMYTSFYMTGNLNNWFKFLKLRLDDHAQEEVQIVALEIKRVIEEYFPITSKYMI
jgi:thymidylate synthase (FAD)